MNPSSSVRVALMLLGHLVINVAEVKFEGTGLMTNRRQAELEMTLVC